jgi:hypothetical protein
VHYDTFFNIHILVLISHWGRNHHFRRVRGRVRVRFRVRLIEYGVDIQKDILVVQDF